MKLRELRTNKTEKKELGAKEIRDKENCEQRELVPINQREQETNETENWQLREQVTKEIIKGNYELRGPRS